MTRSARCILLLGLAGCGRVGFDPLDGRTGGPGGAVDDAATLDGDSAPPADARIDATSIGCGTDPNCVASGFTLNNASTGNAGGTTIFYSDETQGSCGSSGGGDYGARFMVTDNGMYRFTLSAAFDTVLYALDGADCAAPELMCVDNPGTSGEELLLTLTAGNPVVIVVDSNSGCGNFSLDYQAE